VPSFLVEVYTPVGSPVGDAEQRAVRAAEQLSGEGTPVRYLRAIFVPEDEMCFFLFEAPSAALAGEVSRRAGVAYDRIVAYE
jgi:Protein of unknown function (DUF4242)